jgi:hypothetical protein
MMPSQISSARRSLPSTRMRSLQQRDLVDRQRLLPAAVGGGGAHAKRVQHGGLGLGEAFGEAVLAVVVH